MRPARYHRAAMSTAVPALPIHSLAEAYLHLMVTRCPGCGSGPLTADESKVRHDADERILTVPVRCRKCGRERAFRYDTRGVEPDGFLPVPAGTVAAVNRTDEPSSIIDVAGWITLFTLILGGADKTTDPAAARQLKLEAAQCLDEALKFYGPDNDLPPADSFFSECSRGQFRRRPETFSQSRLIGLRAKLPVARTADRVSEGAREPGRARRRRWWWPWSKA